jgi:hemerythrin-like domain-containing protein
MLKKPTVDLVGEHGGIMLMLRILDKVASRLENEQDVKREHLDKIIEFLRNFVDKCHHGKEEEILFPELVKRSENIKIVNELLGEHKTGRDFIRGIAESATLYHVGNPDAYHIAVNAKGYINLLTEHIRKENEVLFPLADEQLSEIVQGEIVDRFEVLERDVIGEGKHEEYHGWLDELKNIYLI